MRLHSSADIVVSGGGMVGTACAASLAKLGVYTVQWYIRGVHCHRRLDMQENTNVMHCTNQCFRSVSFIRIRIRKR